MDSERRTELVRRRQRLAATRNGEYRTFEEGFDQAVAKGFICDRMEDKLAEQLLQRMSKSFPESSRVEYETTDLDFRSCIEFAHALIAASDDTSFALLRSHGAPPVAATGSKESMAEMIVPMLSRQDDLCVICLSDYSGLNLGISHEAYGKNDALYVMAWGTMKPVLLGRIATQDANWFELRK